MTAPGALTERDVAAVREETAADRPVTVWFTAAAVGVPAGRSAKVVGVGDTDEGDFIQVRPAGSRDTMFCSPNELTRTRPARRRAAAPGEGKVGRAATASTTPLTTPAVVPRASGSARSAATRPAAKSAPEVVPVPRKPAAADAEPPVDGVPAATAGTARPARATSTRRLIDGSAGVSVGLTATADGAWTVEVLVGRKRVVPPTPVEAADVATVARALPPAVAEAIESSLEGARQRQRERIEQLRAELDRAQQALDQLGV
jgi:hypothetical protein